ncbi:MAG: ATP-dependent RNA helicase HrpB [Syntrophus sp. PtaU1.Bin208]|nr:MAG: ATP-dependent RNA helicase HrpB [Syntrophus sp. PtaU1.Bin208]
MPATAQKVIVATNIAETSLTIPGIRYVIDSGAARISRYNPRTRTTSLPVMAISRSSADQRKGRCGRVQNGVCIRLYSEEDYLSRPLFSAPEILRSNLAEVILRMLRLRLGHPAAFPFIDAPNPKNIRDGFDILRELGAITVDRKKDRDETRDGEPVVRLTERGRRMARLPMDPRISRILLEAEKEGCLEEATIIASGLCIQDPRERPVDEEGRADAAHRLFVDPSSDFLTLLRIWQKYFRAFEILKSAGKMRRYCRESYLSWRRMREWKDIYDQIRSILQEEERAETTKPDKEASKPEDLYAALHRSILSGYLSGIACKKDKNFYSATRGRDVMLYPGSGLFNNGGNWIIAAEMVETSRLFARTAANIESAWIEQTAGDLCTSTYSEPHWEKRREEVVAYEQVSLFGLVIVPRRKVSYAGIDPEESSRIFIRSALVDGEMKTPLPFFLANRQLVEEVLQMENKIRRRDLLHDESVLEDFYAARLSGISNVRTLKTRIREKGGDFFLRMTRDEILARLPDEEEMALYPDEVTVNGRRYHCVYRFDPGKADDGVTLKIPDVLLSDIPPGSADWMIPGMLRDRVLALLRGLPKEYRKKLQPLGTTADYLVRDLGEPSGHLISALAGLIRTKLDVDIPASAWSGGDVPEFLKVRFAVMDGNNQEKASGRDLVLLQETLSAEQDSIAFERARRLWEKAGLTRWDFGDLPESIDLSDKGSFKGCAWPALMPAEGCVHLLLYRTREEATQVHREGVAALYSLHFSRELRDLKKALILPKPLRDWAEYFGGVRNVEKLILEKVKKDLFAVDVRTEQDFLSHGRQVREKILISGQNAIRIVEPLLKAYCDTASDLRQLQTSTRGSSRMQNFLIQLRKEMNTLLPEDFLWRWSEERLKHIPRYLKALKIRADRALLNWDKDRRREEEIRPFLERLAELSMNLPAYVSDEKKQALADFSQMIEEYRVSLFAQELKTAFPVSARRLEDKLCEIDRMF